MKKLHVIGESFIDRYVFMHSNRIDPATKVPVILSNKEKVDTDGGAANLIKHLNFLFKENKYHEIVFYTNEDKIIKERFYIDHNPIYRFDHGDSVKHNKGMVQNLINDLNEGDFLVISNYHKGLITDYEINLLIKEAKNKNITSFIDTNIVNSEYYGADYLKINNKTFLEYEKDYRDDISKYFPNVIVTLGIEGYKYYGYSHILQNGGGHTKYDFIDSIGAGDSFFASFIYNIVCEKNIYDSLKEADNYAAENCKKLGTLSLN